jgi:hypothetical protein
MREPVGVILSAGVFRKGAFKERRSRMGPFQLFGIRLILSVVFAFIAAKIFLKDTDIVRVGGLALLMLGLAYLLAYLRKRNRE